MKILISENVMNSSVSKAKLLFDQHQSSDCLWIEACAVEKLYHILLKKSILQQQQILHRIQQEREKK